MRHREQKVHAGRLLLLLDKDAWMNETILRNLIYKALMYNTIKSILTNAEFP